MSSNRYRSQHSAGGVVVREMEVGTCFLCIKPAGQDRWQLPKGTIDPGESPIQAAVREVREEGGVDAEIVQPLGTINYFFRSGGRTVAKRVDFFLMRYVSGETDDHDTEVDEAVWVHTNDFVRLTFRNEQQLVTEALSILQGV